MGKYLLFHRHHVVKLLLWIGMEGGDIHYVIECASCCSQCCFQVFKSKPHYSTFNSTNKSILHEGDSAPARSVMRAADGFFKAKFRCPEPNL